MNVLRRKDKCRILACDRSSFYRYPSMPPYLVKKNVVGHSHDLRQHEDKMMSGLLSFA